MRRVGSGCDRLGRAVERDRQDDDHHPGEDCERRVRVEPVRHDVAEPAAADQAGDHDHREREEDRLVDAEEDHPAGERKLHLPEQLRPRRAHRARRLDGVHGDASDAERGDADRRRDRVDHGRHDRRRRPDREEDDDGHQVRERRDDLHRVEKGRDRAGEPIRAPGDDPERNPDEQRERHGDEHERQRLHALHPEPRKGEGRERGERDERSANAAEAPDEKHARQRSSRARSATAGSGRTIRRGGRRSSRTIRRA